MKWTEIERKGCSRQRGEAFISVGRNKLTVSAGAAALIPDSFEYQYATISEAFEGNNRYIGIRLLKERSKNSLTIRRRKSNEKVIQGMEISDRELLSRAFGSAIAQRDGTTRFEVTRDLTASNILMVKLSQSEKKAAKQGAFNMKKLYH